MRITNIIFFNYRPVFASTDFNRDWINNTSNNIREYSGTKIHGQNIKLVNTGDINKSGILGNDLGDCRYVLQCPVIGGNIYYYRAI